MDHAIATSEQLTKNKSNEVFDIEAKRIHADEGFNCRGYIPPSSVIDLGKSIKENGLQQPITIQPYDEAKRQETGFDFRIIQGHRRFTAMTLVLKWDMIPCMITKGLNELDALKQNFIENIQREPLTILQEARALERMQKAGMSQLDMARDLRQERPWVQTRLYILDFPEGIQKLIDEGVIVQAQIHEIHALPPTKWYEAAQFIQDERIKHAGKRIKIRTDKFKAPKPENMLKAKPRKNEEISILLEWLMDNGDPGIHTRMLAWATGEVNTLELLKELKPYIEDLNPDRSFNIPTNGIPGL